MLPKITNPGEETRLGAFQIRGPSKAQVANFSILKGMPSAQEANPQVVKPLFSLDSRIVKNSMLSEGAPDSTTRNKKVFSLGSSSLNEDLGKEGLSTSRLNSTAITATVLPTQDVDAMDVDNPSASNTARGQIDTAPLDRTPTGTFPPPSQSAKAFTPPPGIPGHISKTAAATKNEQEIEMGLASAATTLNDLGKYEARGERITREFLHMGGQLEDVKKFLQTLSSDILDLKLKVAIVTNEVLAENVPMIPILLQSGKGPQEG